MLVTINATIMVPSTIANRSQFVSSRKSHSTSLGSTTFSSEFEVFMGIVYAHSGRKGDRDKNNNRPSLQSSCGPRRIGGYEDRGKQNECRVYTDCQCDILAQLRMPFVSDKCFVAVRCHHAERCPKHLPTIHCLLEQGGERAPAAIGDRNASKNANGRTTGTRMFTAIQP